MVTDRHLRELIKQARDGLDKRRFTQSAELTLILKDIDVKRGFSLNEVVSLPHKLTDGSAICLIGSGDLAMRARKVGIPTVLEPQELDRLGTNKREARKLVRKHDFFLSDTSLMPSVGRSIGQFLGPKGKMPTPLPYGAPLESIVNRFQTSIRLRVKNQLSVSARVGDENMDDSLLANNSVAVVSALEKKLPQGEKNIHGAVFKFTMSRPAKTGSSKAESAG
ncbi:MAG TPA: 50S ribosomal protein L1 [Nitrososphaeraceae archaeon]|nr:50S ribosomal protein L1 [Nitrososphaeraceae archaeon]